MAGAGWTQRKIKESEEQGRTRQRENGMDGNEVRSRDSRTPPPPSIFISFSSILYHDFSQLPPCWCFSHER